eukprot:gnl/MRDRNA2_/MRDRNA2_20508_c0_seq1.p1 gnl/MRDRNA2_/MRDRNA2_20508_c0~~gnl/MRDRNA2_/MRDRNA2_20508_c0_seq1.p1  ORF type:complete len:818 (+),score=140.74 gnl/MRDRNA2_/MRDRNA2_20508_c0_seq1:144-2456(+)
MAVVVTLAVTTQPSPVESSAAVQKPEMLENFQMLPELEMLPAEGLFKELSPKEVSTVARFAAEKLGCSTRYESLSKCFLSGCEAVSLKQPPKAAVLAHLDNGAAPPPRTAQVIVAHGEKSPEEGVGIYEVGPLDGIGGLKADASIKLIQSLHWNRRPLDFSDSSIGIPVDKTVNMLKDLLLNTFGPIWPQFADNYQPTTKGSLSAFASSNVFSSVSHRSSRVWFNWYKDINEFQVNWLHSIPFGFDVLHQGPLEEQRVENVSYCGQTFATPDLLLKAFEDQTLKLCKDVEQTDYSRDVPGPNPGTRPASLNPGAGPAAALPTIQKTWQITPGGSVRWKDWEFVATLRPGTGLAIHDVRFRSERILYELALAEAQAFYSAPEPAKQFHYSDKAVSLLQLSGDMVEGLDCPKGASFIDASIWIYTWRNTSFTYDPGLAKGMKGACVFESDGFQGSGWRHTQLINRHVTGRALRQLVVRAVATVGNYDYITEVRFSEDGHVHVGEDFAGYPEVDRFFHRAAARSLAFEDAPDWGSVVQVRDRENLAGDNVQNLHSHFALFKVDLDVLGTENEFHITTSEVSAEGALPKKIQKTRRVDKEDSETTFVANPTKPGVWRILNPEKINARTGTPRGYAIMMGASPALQTLPKDHPFTLASSHAKRHLAVTQRKDEEPTGVHNLDAFSLPEPLYSVDKFLSDGESLVGEDLVCWVSLGKDHIARAEDQPLVSNFGVYFTILPWDYHEENAAMQLPMVGKGPEAEVTNFQDVTTLEEVR